MAKGYRGVVSLRNYISLGSNGYEFGRYLPGHARACGVGSPTLAASESGAGHLCASGTCGIRAAWPARRG
eukprot:scaffold117928_cov32-Prasinocladus_malaysianus.AAC.4